jgi:RNA polymerase subunit RPABC4/transcription elongation factor Spt4
MLEFASENIVLGVAIYAGVVLIAFWLAIIIWVYRDMKARSRDSLLRLLVALFVAILNVPGLLIYLFLRPRETLAESYERSLEEEALLQEIEEKPVCPTCGIRTHEDWQVCPSCHTRLKKVCIQCHRLLELSWNICPHCATSQVSQDSAEWYQETAVSTRYETPPAPRQRVRRTTESLEFVEGDEY